MHIIGRANWGQHMAKLLVDVVIFLAAALIAVPIAVRLGFGAVLGYLVAGVMIGPWALKLVTDIDAISISPSWASC